MYKGYCLREQEVAATKTIFCLFALREVWLCCILECSRSHMPDFSSPSKSLNVSAAVYLIDEKPEETFGHLVRKGRLRNGAYFVQTLQKQKGSKLMTCCSLFSFSEKEAFSTCGVMNNRFIFESPTSVCLSLPLYRLVLSHLFFIIYK